MNRAAALSLTAACLLGCATAAPAGPIASDNIAWGYQFSVSPQYQSIGGGYIFLPGNGASDNMSSAPFSPKDVQTSLYTRTDATQANPHVVTDAPFALTLNITDKGSPSVTGAVTFSGFLNGSVWNTGSNLTPTFTPAMASQTLQLDHHIYDINFESFKSPTGNGPPGHSGAFVFDVSVHHNPEPSSLVLAGIGAPLFGMVWRRRRN